VDTGRAEAVRSAFGFSGVVSEFDALLADPEIDVIDICAPPFLHVDMVAAAMKAGKHVICEKPLSGYFGKPGDPEPVGRNVPRKVMYEHVVSALNGLAEVVQQSSSRFFYAENHLYAPPVRRIADIIARKKSRILFMKANIALKGSSSAVAGEWRATGGGSLARNGVHPLAALLWLKRVDAEARGESITAASVLADTGTTTTILNEHEHRHISARPVDVEDNALVVVTFSDGTKASVFASDTALGGTRNNYQVYCNDAAFECNLTPTDMLSTYFLDEDGIEDLDLAEMLPTRIGWNRAFVSDDVVRGYSDELQQFCNAIVSGSETPSDFAIAALTTKVIYAAYLSAEEGRRVEL
jgi:predicted dehydrogenase